MTGFVDRYGMALAGIIIGATLLVTGAILGNNVALIGAGTLLIGGGAATRVPDLPGNRF